MGSGDRPELSFQIEATCLNPDREKTQES